MIASGEYHFLADDAGNMRNEQPPISSLQHQQESNLETERLTTKENDPDQSNDLDQQPLDSNVNPLEHRRRRRTVFLFSITTVLLFADQNLLSPNLTAIADEFGFTEEERDRKLGGDIALAFFLLGAPASFLVGCLADQSDRSILFAWTVGIGEGACLATFWTRTYTQLYICRAITGFSIGGAIPLIYSVLGDLFVAEDRHAVSAVIGIGTGCGIAFGQGVAGFLGPTFGWRVPFLVVSIPALICAALVLFTVPDPPRGNMERVVMDMREHPMESSGDGAAGIEMKRIKQSNGDIGSHIDDKVSNGSTTAHDGDEIIVSTNRSTCGQDWRSHFATLFSLLSCPTVILTFLQGAPGCMPWGIVNSFLNDFLSEDRGMSVEGATATVLFFGLGNFFGMLAGGGGGKMTYAMDPRYPALLAGFAAILGCIPFWLLLNTVDENSPLLYIIVVTLLGGLGTGITGPIVKATLQNVTLPTTRGQAFAIYNLFDDFGRGLGPVFVSLLIVNMGGRTPAFNAGTFGWVVCGVLNIAIFFTVAKDERKAQESLAATLHYVPFANREEEKAVRESDTDTTFDDEAEMGVI